MASKSFVSILISSNKLQLVKLDGSRTKIEKKATVALPQGIIKDYKVIDEGKLSEYIKFAFKEGKFAEKNIGIIVPEFSTYTKLIELPGLLEDQELDEAVRWQAKDFVPASEKDLVMDWKILDSQMEKNRILFVAIDKNVLTGYVDAASSAGFYPLVVETQSLAVSRIAGAKGKTRLVMYNNLGEVVLLIATGEQILGTSVVGSNDEIALATTAGEMVKHYAAGKLEKVVVGGSGFSQQFYNKLKAQINMPIEGIQKTLKDISDKDFQEYLIPISQQLQDPYEPRDERSVNLLPPSWSKKYSYKKLSRRIWSLMFVSSIVLWSLLALVLGNYIFLKSRLNNIKMMEEITDQQVINVVSQIEAINQRIAAVRAISDAEILPQDILNSITAAKPSGVDIQKQDLDLDKGAFTIQGIAATRDDLLVFKQQLEMVEEFENVRIPIDTLAKEFDISFTVTLNYAGIEQQKVIKLKLN